MQNQQNNNNNNKKSNVNVKIDIDDEKVNETTKMVVIQLGKKKASYPIDRLQYYHIHKK